MLPPVFLAAFPALATDDPVVTHPPDPGFNCVAWAAGTVDAVWWPADPDGYWPPGVPDELTVAAMVAALGTVGYVPCDGGEPEPGFEKAAVYAVGCADTRLAPVGRRPVVEQVGKGLRGQSRHARRGRGSGLRVSCRVPAPANGQMSGIVRRRGWRGPKGCSEMKTAAASPDNIDDYIAGFPADVRRCLNQVRAAVRRAAPDAVEAIKYRMPTFVLDGNLVHFAAFKNHVGFYPTPSAIEEFKQELAPYKSTKARCSSRWISPCPSISSGGWSSSG